MERSEILSFLTKLKKPVSEDPKRTWIGSYNIRQLIIVSFFKWLFDPTEHDYKLRKSISFDLCVYSKIYTFMYTNYFLNMWLIIFI